MYPHLVLVFRTLFLQPVSLCHRVKARSKTNTSFSRSCRFDDLPNAARSEVYKTRRGNTKTERRENQTKETPRGHDRGRYNGTKRERPQPHEGAQGIVVKTGDCCYRIANAHRFDGGKGLPSHGTPLLTLTSFWPPPALLVSTPWSVSSLSHGARSHTCRLFFFVGVRVCVCACARACECVWSSAGSIGSGKGISGVAAGVYVPFISFCGEKCITRTPSSNASESSHSCCLSICLSVCLLVCLCVCVFVVVSKPKPAGRQVKACC